MDTQKIKKLAIYPAIGIARIGNSPEFFLASDIPGKAPAPESGFKDGDNKLKKQVVRFRVYAMDANDNPLGEIINDLAEIHWRVHVANRKAAWYQFMNAMDLEKKAIDSTRRNGGITGAERQKLVIDPGVKTIHGKNKIGSEFKLEGEFLGKKCSLGELRTDNLGRLLFFGGDGISGSDNDSRALTFANNDYWHDDVSDGTVRATVTINGQTIEAEPAIVICTPPNFGPGLFPVVSMYDIVFDLHIREGAIDPPSIVDFYKHIYPILDRMSGTQWVNHGFFILFGKNSPSDFSNNELLAILSDPDPQYKAQRMRVLTWFRNPKDTKYEPSLIPPHYGDFYDDYFELSGVDLSVTNTQYSLLRRWADGNFIVGKKEQVISFDDMNSVQQTKALLRAPLEECLGGPFHPGIEITWPFRCSSMWEKPFRLKVLPENEIIRDDYGPLLTASIALSEGGPIAGSGPGTNTRWLGVPWQTDGASCLSGYDLTLYLPLPSFWATRVPNTVLSKDSYERASNENLNTGQRLKHFSYRVDWLRDLRPSYVDKINDMVKKWHELGLVVQQNGEDKTKNEFLPEKWWVETGRKDDRGQDPTFKQVLNAEKEENLFQFKFGETETRFEVDNTRVTEKGRRTTKPLRRNEL